MRIKLNLAWFLYYGRQLGMSRREILHCPVGELLDYIDCMQIQNGAKPKVYADVDELMAIQ